MRHSLKFRRSGIEIRRTCVGIGKPSPIIYCVDEMRTVTLRTNVDAGIECGGDHSQAVICTHHLRGN